MLIDRFVNVTHGSTFAHAAFQLRIGFRVPYKGLADSDWKVPNIRSQIMKMPA